MVGHVTYSADEIRKAHDLFEAGRYDESYTLCINLLKEKQDPQTEVLAATNLYYLERLDEAELHFRDLAGKMPDSSHVHGYLGKILLEKGDEGAIAELATAVRIDPDNQDALRNYVRCLGAVQDYRRSLPALRRLAELSSREDDRRALIRTLITVGEGAEALRLYQKFPSLKTTGDPLEIDALVAASEFSRASAACLEIYNSTGDPQYLRKHLHILSRFDTPSALSAYRDAWEKGTDPGIARDYIELLMNARQYADALLACRALLRQKDNRSDELQLLECQLLAATGEVSRAKAAYEERIKAGSGNTGTDEFLKASLPRYREFMLTYFSRSDVVHAFDEIVSASGANPVCLFETGTLYEQLGDVVEARGWYYRAYRSDFLSGGLIYARFLARHKDWRECEKVLLYILSNVRRTQDITRVAEITTGDDIIHHTPRLLSRLIGRMEERKHELLAGGLEFLAVAYLVAGTAALAEGDHALCKRYCLKGLDVLPAYSGCISTGDFVAVLSRCKERAVVDALVMDARSPEKDRMTREKPETRIQDLDPQEQKIIDFLTLHRHVDEADLRTLLGTRRVGGIMNRLIAKCVAQGLRVVTKIGSGEKGDIYEYAG